ncbi:MAG: CDP-alcohol phosphatidyltransferase family protein [Candidatus Helarchaeota archaeon]|nr:CDP-alcohol phosphatidyltransferase family protein [Candidatus Helarchaeota archaeon]
MNIANILTVIRIPIAIACIGLILVSTVFSLIFALTLYSIACFTDLFDGLLARRRNIVSDTGTILDSIADKVLNVGVLLTFAVIGVIDIIIVVIITVREIIITGTRLYYLVKHNIALSAKKLGKFKFVSQLAAIIFTFVIYTIYLAFPLRPNPEIFLYQTYVPIFMWCIAIITILTGAYYIWNNRKIIMKRINENKTLEPV